MKVRVTKPQGGKVDLRIDDRRGATGLLLVEKGVPVKDVAIRVAPMIAQWEERRRAVFDARKGIVA